MCLPGGVEGVGVAEARPEFWTGGKTNACVPIWIGLWLLWLPLEPAYEGYALWPFEPEYPPK